MRFIRRCLYLASFVMLQVCITPRLAFAAVPAHDAPEGSEWIMADWMFLSFAIFAGAAFILFLLALKAGLLSNLEGEAKLYMLGIPEDDYYTPEWARTGGES
jgi:hypothetical protein